MKNTLLHNFLSSQPTDKDKEEYVAGELIQRGQ